MSERARLEKVELAIYEALRPWFSLKNASTNSVSAMPLLLCVSGGADSMGLLHGLQRVLSSALWHKNISLPYGIVELHAIHFNHEKRGAESDRDELLVQKVCKASGVPLICERWSQTGPQNSQANFQEAARSWRYSRALFHLHALSKNTGWIATAHHARDHAETVLLHLIRGCGIQGLLGIDTACEESRLLRPLAQTSFAELNSYVCKNEIEFRQDESNNQNDYSRNLIRHKLLPLIAELNPSYEKTLCALSQNLRNQSEVFSAAQAYDSELASSLSRNSIKNIVHHLRLAATKNGITYKIPLGSGWSAGVEKDQITFIKNPGKE